MKEKKNDDRYFLIISRRNETLRNATESDDVLKFRISKDGKIFKYRKNVKDLGIVKNRVNGDYYNYNELINSVVDAIIEDLHLQN
jgi:hypothetical protein